MFGKYKLGRHLKNLKNSDRRNFFDPSFSTWKNDSRIMRWFFKITGLLRTGGSFWNGAIGIKGGYVDAGIYKNFSLKCPFFHVIQWYIHNFAKPNSPRFWTWLTLYIWYLLGISRYGKLLMGCSLFLILINYKDISFVMIESLHLRKNERKKFF